MSKINIHEWPDLYEPTWGDTSKNYAFISYSHEDSDIVYQDLRILSDNGARIWYDKAMHIGQNWMERAKSKIFDKNCAAVIFYISPNSLKSSAFLQELDYAIQRSKTDECFTYISVNIGGKTTFETLKTIDVPENVFLKILLAFNENKLFIPRDLDPFNTNHILKTIDVFEDIDALDSNKCTINQVALFDFVEYGQGLQIVQYNGSDSTVNVPALNNGKKIIAIGINAFKNNTAIKRINIPEGVQLIDDFAFSGCYNIESVTLPNSLLSIGYETFRDCSNLRKIVIPYNVEKIGDYCFYKCHQLNNITILSVAPLKIGFAAFSECHAIENIVLPESLDEIGPYAFNNCINITSLTIPINVKKIGLSAFYNCTSLSCVTFETVHLLENNRYFARCRNLKQLIFRSINKTQYLNNESWTSFKEKMLFVLNAPTGISYESGILTWDTVTAADYYIIKINDQEFESLKPFLKIPQYEETPKILVSVRACSYDDCVLNSDASLELQIKTSTDIYEIVSTEHDIILSTYSGNMPTVNIPEGITIIGEDVFYNHEEIREVVFPDSLKKIGKRAFYHCINLQKLHLPENLIEIGDDAFWGVAIQELTIPKSVTLLGKSCFACCNDLYESTILTSNFTSGSKMFYRCINLKKVNLPDGLEELPEDFFRGCTELENVTFPDSLKSIRTGAISYVMHLKRLIIPNSVRIIEEQAFSNSFALSDIYVDDANEAYFDSNGILFSKASNHLVCYPADKKLYSYSIDDSITEICNYAFTDVEHLERIVFGNGVRKIGKSAFERCSSLKEVIITGDLKHIGSNAFKDCINLERLYILSEFIPEIEHGVFDNIGSNFKILIPEKYKKNYFRIIEWQEYHYLLYGIDDTQIPLL